MAIEGVGGLLTRIAFGVRVHWMHPFGGLRLSHGHKISDALKLTPMEKLELRIKQLEAENAILKKVAALKDWRN